MDNYAIARAESRIDQLESEVQQLRLDAVRYKWEERSRRLQLETGFFYWMGMAALAALPIVLAITKHKTG